jgi:hypothetical protein
VVLTDYEVRHVKGYGDAMRGGFGTLRAGTVVTDPDALRAALADDAELVFLRVQNTWGGMPVSKTPAGYTDIYWHDSYLERPLKIDCAGQSFCDPHHSPIMAVVLPAGY